MAIIECVPNISEGRRADVVAAIVGAVRRVPGVRVLDYSSDASHNRSVLTLAGDAAPLKAAVLALFEAAVDGDRPADALGRASAPRRRGRRPVRPDRRRDDGRVRRTGEGDRRGGGASGSACRSTCTKRPRQPPHGATSKTSAAASSRGSRRRWRARVGTRLWALRAAPLGRCVGHRRAHAAHRLQHQPRHRPPRRGEEDRRRHPPQQRRLPLREGDGHHARGPRHRAGVDEPDELREDADLPRLRSR